MISVEPTYDDDGIGTSDDETNSNSSTAAKSNVDDDVTESNVDDDVTESNVDDDDENGRNVAECDDDETEDKLKSRRVIKPDMSALNRLLAFDEVIFLGNLR